MRLYEVDLIFHDNLFYETRTLGRLYETGRLLHNIALCYALGLAKTPYHQPIDAPSYRDEMADLNEAGIYVTPAKDVDIHYVVHTFKYGEEHTSVRMERSNANLPTFGRAKEIGVGSQFRFGVLSESSLQFPKWIRMGIWMSKAHLSVNEIPLRAVGADEKTVSHYPLNPRDLPESAELKIFDLVSMRPNSLVENALIRADAWWQGVHPRTERPIFLPVGMVHHV